MPSETGVSGASGSGSGGGGSGGGDASAANQTLTLAALDDIYDALSLVGLEATNIQIRDAVTGLGDGATLADLATAFATDAITQSDILDALEASEIDLDAIKSGIDLLVPDLDAVRVATEATNAKIPASPAQDRTTAASPSAFRASNGTSFIDLVLDATATAGNTILAAIRDRLPVALVNGRLDVNVGASALPSGAATAATSVSVVPATITSTSAGAITPVNFKLIKGSAGRLRAVRAIHGGATPSFLQVHDVASTGAVTSSTMVEGLTVKLDGVDVSAEFDFRASPHSFVVGCVLALSGTRDTYTVTVNTAQFYAQWE